jgi:hypothetical protein
MAREVVITDDITGEQGAEPFEFTWDGVNREIDLTPDSRKKLEDLLKPYLEKSRMRQAPTDAERKQTAPRRQRRAEGKIDYSSPEHAGKPHRGRVTEAEAAYVREHFDEVNQRLSREGMRTLDRSDAKVRERYGL